MLVSALAVSRTGASAGRSGRSPALSARVPHHSAGSAAGHLHLARTGARSVSRASRWAAARRSGSGLVLSAAVRAAPRPARPRESGRRGRPDGARPSRRARSRKRDACSPSSSVDATAVTTRRWTARGCKRRRRAAARRPAGARVVTGATRPSLPMRSARSSVARRRRSGQPSSWTWATTTSRHSRPLARWAVSSRTASPRMPRLRQSVGRDLLSDRGVEERGQAPCGPADPRCARPRRTERRRRRDRGVRRARRHHHGCWSPAAAPARSCRTRPPTALRRTDAPVAACSSGTDAAEPPSAAALRTAGSARRRRHVEGLRVDDGLTEQLRRAPRRTAACLRLGLVRDAGAGARAPGRRQASSPRQR